MDKVTSNSYKTNVKDFLDNSHDLNPFESDISKHDIQELPIHYIPDIKLLEFNHKLIDSHVKEYNLNPTLC